LAHAYLFTGPPGVGKRRFAHELAKAQLCESSDGRFDACDGCQSCLLVAAGTHPDFFSVCRPDDKQEFPIEVIRQLCGDLAMKPARGNRKIAVVDDADDLNEESANSFLKALEEPPPGSLLILVGTSPDGQLPTIRSRCQVVPFAKLPDFTVRELLGAEHDLEPASVTRLVNMADGSPGLARDLADPALWAFRQKLFDSLARTTPETPALAKELQELVEAVGKEAGAQRRRATIIIRLLLDGFRRALDAATAGPRTDGDSVDEKALAELARKFGADGLVKVIDRCLEADAQIGRRVQLVLALEALLDALGYD
jgi:DNA polymerase-3 subunit delta'